jgi:hypothetical protein
MTHYQFPILSVLGVSYSSRMLWDGVTALVARAKQGDTEALERLYQTAQPYLLQLAQRPDGGWGKISPTWTQRAEWCAS